MTILKLAEKLTVHPRHQAGSFRPGSAGADVLTPSAEAVAEAQRILDENAKGVRDWRENG